MKLITGNSLTRQRFATVDMANNFTFEYKDNFSDEKVFSSKLTQLMIHHIILCLAT